MAAGLGGPASADDAAPAPPDAAPAAAELPPTAVALGDSFVSGEGAGAYQPVVDQSGATRDFPGWSADNADPYFCHRSANASIQVADLPGITQRVNLACSGAQPADFASPSSAREGGRGVAAQLDQLRTVAQTHDVDVVLVGLGSNNSHFTFGTVAAECAGRFVGDGYTGWWEVWIDLLNWINGTELNEDPCTDADLANPDQFAAAQADTTAALRQLLDVLDEVDADGVHRVVLQDYTNPLPEAYAEDYLTEDGRDDERDKYRALVDERYAAGCPADVASLAPAHRFSQGLGTMVAGAAATLRAERPGVDVTYLNVQHAFDGARLCENPGSPAGALPTPLRVMDGPSGTFVESFGPFDKLDIKRVTDTCSDYYQTCQESWHPSAAGHQVLGQCLSVAWTTGGATLTCRRNPDGSITAG
ncbi:GDSL-type esterase/lipase family protein [Nocardioides marinquilinus]|uniref:GDSL-type esterase/lipase family protein n=1 Tax=Nocardioides marinquilinus TaxID=1210400 RepID=A0ABP9P9W7_9ACTN